MVQKRVIPCLLLHKCGLYKTIKFRNPNYIGDPINAIRIFNEKEVDELMFLDIDATSQNREPNYKLIENIAGECFMPLSYGGGVKTIEQMKRIYYLGVEKISLSSVAVENPQFIREASSIFGSQSVIVTIDVKTYFWRGKKVFTYNGKKNSKFDVLNFVKIVEDCGAGEIVINSIDNDGMMNGYDIELLKEVQLATNIPIIALGGAGCLQHLREAIEKANLSAVAVGSLFVYQGPLKGVLINYPTYETIQDLFRLGNSDNKT